MERKRAKKRTILNTTYLFDKDRKKSSTSKWCCRQIYPETSHLTWLCFDPLRMQLTSNLIPNI